MNDGATVTCIIPVHNGRRYLGQALDSVFSQTFPVSEVIVVDDGSTDGTGELLADRSEEIVVLRQENAGPGAARNRGIEAASGALVAFLDSDDTWDPEFIERGVKAFQTDPDLDACLCRDRSEWTSELAELEARYADPRRGAEAVGAVTRAMLVRREVVDRVGPFAPELRTGEDQDWYLRLVESGARIHVLPEVLVRRRLHPWNMTRLESDTTNDNLLALVKRSLDRRRQGRQEIEPLDLPSSDPSR